jgi:hypothetical protein
MTQVDLLCILTERVKRIMWNLLVQTEQQIGGSYNPSTGKIENKKGFDKHRGAIDERDSLITKENGFEDIRYSGIGGSPFSVIDEMDSKYPTIK